MWFYNGFSMALRFYTFFFSRKNARQTQRAWGPPQRTNGPHTKSKFRGSGRNVLSFQDFQAVQGFNIFNIFEISIVFSSSTCRECLNAEMFSTFQHNAKQTKLERLAIYNPANDQQQQLCVHGSTFSFRPDDS